jgi:hypothetical protein
MSAQRRYVNGGGKATVTKCQNGNAYRVTRVTSHSFKYNTRLRKSTLNWRLRPPYLASRYSGYSYLFIELKGIIRLKIYMHATVTYRVEDINISNFITLLLNKYNYMWNEKLSINRVNDNSSSYIGKFLYLVMIYVL